MKTKDIIIQKTFALLLEKGYDGVSVSDICQASGMARGLLYHYFKNKDELLLGIGERFFSEKFLLAKATLKDKSIGELIVLASAYFNNIIDDLVIESRRKITLLDCYILLYQVGIHYPSFAEKLQRNKESWFAVWKVALLNSFAKGELRTGLNMESVARHFVYIINGVILNASENQRDTIYDMEKGLWEFFEIIKR